MNFSIEPWKESDYYCYHWCVIDEMLQLLEYKPHCVGNVHGKDSGVLHDKGLIRALNSHYTPHSKFPNPKSTVFVWGLRHHQLDDDLTSLFSKFGEILSVNVVRDIVTRFAKGYAFIHFLQEKDALRAVRKLHGSTRDGKTILCDLEMERRMKGWMPRRLGGGFGGRKESGQVRFGGKMNPFKEVSHKIASFEQTVKDQSTKSTNVSEKDVIHYHSQSEKSNEESKIDSGSPLIKGNQKDIELHKSLRHDKWDIGRKSDKLNKDRKSDKRDMGRKSDKCERRLLNSDKCDKGHKSDKWDRGQRRYKWERRPTRDNLDKGQKKDKKDKGLKHDKWGAVRSEKWDKGHKEAERQCETERPENRDDQKKVLGDTRMETYLVNESVISKKERNVKAKINSFSYKNPDQTSYKAEKVKSMGVSSSEAEDGEIKEIEEKKICKEKKAKSEKDTSHYHKTEKHKTKRVKSYSNKDEGVRSYCIKKVNRTL